MKLLITTRADSGVQEYADISHPIFKDYAEKVGADFMVLDHESGCTEGNGRWHYRILKHGELHDEYDRILHLDTDLLLNPNCPNIFDAVEYNNIGTVLEDVGSRKPDRHHRIFAAQQQFGDIGWKEEYINRLRLVVRSVWDEWAAKSPMSKKVIDAQKKWLREIGRIE